MLIGYDHQIFSLQPYGGVSRYFVELATEVSVLGADVAIVAPFHLNRLLAERPGVDVRGAYVPHLRGTGRARRSINAIGARLRFSAMQPDLVHETYFSNATTAPVGVPTVVTVFDMIHERFPDSFRSGDSTPSRKKAAVQRAARVICISESTRRDLLSEIDVDPSLVTVTYLAADVRLPSLAKPRRLVDGDYLLYVGQRDGYKNFAACAAAFAESGLGELRFKLVCFGGGRWTENDELAVENAGLPSSTVARLHGGDDVLSRLYADAAALVYPSLYEGFGIPPLEAMICGCPVACANASSLPEVVGDAAELFDPSDKHDIARAIVAIVGDASRAAELRSRGRVRAATFSWQRCAQETLSVYEAAVGRHRHA